jgi:hypothetical protein
MSESAEEHSKKLDELAEMLRELDRRRGLSVQQVVGLLAGSLILVFLVGPIAVLFLGGIVGPIFASVFIAMLIMFIFEDMRSSNITKRTGIEKETEEIEEEGQETLNEVGDKE